MSEQDSIEFHELSKSKRAAIVWSFFWRGFVATICSALGGGLLGGVLGALVAVCDSLFRLGLPRDRMVHLSQILGGIGGACVGITVIWFYVAWLFRARISGLRLKLVNDAQRT